MKKKRFTLDDLYDFYVNQNKSCNFSSEDAHANLVVGIPSTISFAKDENDIEGLCPVQLQSCHIGQNRNGSYISEADMKKALPSFSNRPILGYIHEVDGEPQFYTHNMYIDDEGEMIYEEHPIGIIPESCNAKLEYDKDKDKTYVVVNGYIFEEYSKACQILEREKECDVSVELAIRELSYDAKNKRLDITDFYFAGVTILGYDEDGNKINPGMEGSNIKLADFSRTDDYNNDMNFKLIETLEKLNTTLSSFNIDNLSGKEEKDQVDFEAIINTLLEKYGKTKEDIDFEYNEDMTVEVIEELFAKAFGEVDNPPSNDEPDTDEEPELETNDTDAEDITEELVTSDEPEEDESDDELEMVTEADNTISYSVTVGGKTKTFSSTLSEQLSALSVLVNDTYNDDNDWYSVDADPDKKIVYMYGWNKSYRQLYKVKKDVFSLVGDRVEITPVWMSEDEKKKFEEMLSNYSSISEELNKYKAEPEKMEIIESADYSKIVDTEEYKEIEANHFDLSTEEIREKLDATLLKYAKAGKVDFSFEKDKSSKMVRTINNNVKQTKKSGRYGNLFN